MWSLCLRLHPKGGIAHSFKIWILKSDQHVLSHTHYGILSSELIPIFSSIKWVDKNNLPCSIVRVAWSNSYQSAWHTDSCMKNISCYDWGCEVQSTLYVRGMWKESKAMPWHSASLCSPASVIQRTLNYFWLPIKVDIWSEGLWGQSLFAPLKFLQSEDYDLLGQIYCQN